MSAIKKIIKEARVRPDSNIHNEICSSLNNTEVLLQLGFEELDYCLKNHFISMRDLSYIFSEGDRASKLMVMDLGFNPSREGLDYAKKNNDFDMAERIFLMGISATEEDLSWAIDNNKTEFYKFFKDLNPAVFIDELMSEKKYEEVAKLVKEKGEFPKSVLDYKNCKEVLKLLDEDLWSSTVDEIMKDLISKKDISSLKLMVEKLPTIRSGHLESIAGLGDIELFKLALEKNRDVNQWVLCGAARSGNLDIFKLALEYNTEVTDWVLRYAADSGNPDIFKLALEHNPKTSENILCIAAQSGYIDNFKLALEYDDVSDSVLSDAADSGNPDLFKLALEYNPKVTNWVLKRAAESGSIDIFRLALEKISDIDDKIINYTGIRNNAEMLDLVQKEISKRKNPSEEINESIENKIDKLMNEKKYEEVAKLVKEKGEFPKSVLDYKNCKEVLKLLDEDLWSSTVDEIMEDLISKKDISSLKLMVERLPTISSDHLESIAGLGNIEIFKLALECSSEVTLGVLGCAAYSGNVDVFKLALEYSYDVTEEVLGCAAGSGNVDVFKLAREYNSEVTEGVLESAARSGNLDLFKLALEYNSEVDEWVLRDAASSGNLDLFKLALEYNSEVDEWVLRYAALSGNIDLFKLALEYNPKVTNWVLRDVAKSGNLDIFKLALEYNSEVDEWVLESAAKSGNIDILKLALERNPSPSKEIIKYIKEKYNFEIPESTPVKKSEATEITQNKKDNNGNAFINPFDNFDETEEQNQNPVKKTHTTNNKNVAKSLFPDVSPLLQGAVNQIIFEDGKGLYTFLKTVKDMGIEYSLEDIIDISKNGEVKDKLNASLSSEMSEQVINSRLFNIAFRILETPKSISAFLNKNQNIDIYQKANALFQKLMSENRDSGISKDRIIKIIEKRAKDFDLIRLCEDLERLAKFSYYKSDDE